MGEMGMCESGEESLETSMGTVEDVARKPASDAV